MGHYVNETALMLARRDATEGTISGPNCGSADIEGIIWELDYVRGLAYSAGVTASDLGVTIETARELAAEALR